MLLTLVSLQIRVIRAIILREIRTRFGRNRLGYVWALIDPTIHIYVLYALMHYIGRKNPPGMSLAVFLFIGVLSWYMFSNTFNRCMMAVPGNRPLLFFPQVNVINITVARAVLEMSTKAVVFTILLFIQIALGEHYRIFNFPHFVISMFLLGVLGMSLGLAVGSISLLSPTVGQIFPVVIRALYFLSGVLYAVNELPPRARDILQYNPVLHLIDQARDGFSAGYVAHYTNLSYPLWFTLVVLTLGLLLANAARRRVEF